MSQDAPQSGDGKPLDIVASLRAALDHGGIDVLSLMVGQLDALERSLRRFIAEHAGMADEILRVYEQLGVVFELTRRLPNVRDETEVVRLYVDNLAPSYPGVRIMVSPGTQEVDASAGQSDVPAVPWVQRAVDDCCDKRRVVVADCPDCRAEADLLVCECKRQDGACASTFMRVMCGPIYAGEKLVAVLVLGQAPTAVLDEGSRLFDASDMLLLDSLNVFCGDMIRNFRLLAEVRQLSVDMVRVLVGAIEQKDEYTSGHSARVGHFAVLLGKETGLAPAELQMLEWAALLHDIGKIGIRDEVLKKPGKLTEEEFKHIQEHPVRSFQVVRQVQQLSVALEGVRHHHEHWDGGGYPDGLAGEAIPLMARLIQVADVFDALTSTRSYRKAFDWTKALSIMREEAGVTLDPDLTEVFSALIERLAVGRPETLDQIWSIRCGSNPNETTSPEQAVETGGV